MKRFRPRAPVPPRPARTLIFSNSSGTDAVHVRAIREACARSGISVEMSGFKSGTVLDRPEEALGSYDLVFAKARAALEAAATGAAVVLCDVAGTGPMVTTENFAALRRINFGMRTLRKAATVDALSAEIARYDAADAMDVARQVRALAGQDVLVDQLLGIYGDVLAEPKETDLDAEHRAAAAYLRTLSPDPEPNCSRWRSNNCFVCPWRAG